MVDQVDNAVRLVEGIRAHRAVVAWESVGAGPSPTEVRVLKERSKGVHKSAVYWLRDAAPDGGAVIAKMAKREAAAVETLIYRDVLSPTSVAAPRLLGHLDEGHAFSWIFLEHVQGERYTPRRPDHRDAAGAWLGELHAAVADAARRARLPDRGADHYLSWAAQGRDAMADAADYSAMTREERAVAGELRASLEALVATWDDVVGVVELLPATLVHGDFVRKNLLVRGRDEALAMVAFDWEKAGWGTPAIDLAYGEESKRFAASPSLERYRRALGEHGVWVDAQTIERCAAVGTALRCLSGIGWAAAGLSADWIHRPMSYMAVYARWLEDALAVAGIGGRRARP